MKKILIYAFLLFSICAESQIPLTLKDAIDSALQNNFDIRIARNNTEIGRINNRSGMSGGLPSVNATAGENKSLYNLSQKLSNGTNINRNNVNSNSYNAGVTAGIILFNGFRITATKGRLNYLLQQSELQLNQQVQNTIAAIMETYYDILRQQTYLRIILSSLDVSSKKLDIVNNRYKVGMANEADILQAKMDFNLAEQNANNQHLIIEQAKISLLQLMAVKKYTPVSINDTIIIDPNIRQDSIINFLENNPQYLSAEQQIKINEQIVKEIRSQRYPSVRLNAGYNFTYNSSTAGFNLFTRNYGPAAGVTAQIPIFNGNIYRNQQEEALFNVKNAQLQKESLLNSLKSEAIRTYQSYENTLLQIKSQKTNYEDAAKLVYLVVQRFRLNQATILDVKAAQTSFEDAGYMYVNLQYAAKIAEIELKRLIYELRY